jgi:serine/threonine protein kinase
MPSFDFILAGRYKLIAPLGEGGMASVYRARDLRLNRDVAVKVLRDELTRDADFLSRFQREAETVASLSHPNIVPVYDVGEEDGSHFIVMEYVRGRTLKDAIEAGGPLPPARAAQIVCSVLDALTYAHSHGLIHRDVKPQNILLAADGTARLADFGIAHIAGSSTTRTAAILGSAHYLSPEQSRGEEATVRSDIYATGVVLYESLAGRPPFDGANALAIAHLHLRETPPPLPPETPAPTGAAVKRALEKDPAARFPDAAAFAAALRAPAEPSTDSTALQPLTDGNGTAVAPLVRNRDDPAASQRRRAVPEQVVLRRSTRKSGVLALSLLILLGAIDYILAITSWGTRLPHFPSTPYMLVPLAALLVTAVTWLNARSWQYTLDGNAAVVQWGLLGHHRYGVPLRSISALELKQSPVDRLLGLGTIEMRARDAQGREQRLIMEDVSQPRQTYDELVRMLGRHRAAPLPAPER